MPRTWKALRTNNTQEYICDEMDLLKVSKSGDSPSHVPVSGLVVNPFGHLHLLSAHIVGSGQL